MPAATATVATAQGGRLLQRLSRHWSHQFAVTCCEERLQVPFSDDASALVTASREFLTIHLFHRNAMELERLKRLVSHHLQRLETDQMLAFRWSSS